MPQVVESQALDVGGLADPLEGLGDRVRAHSPYPAIDTSGQDVQNAQGGCGERHPARRPGLRLGDQENSRLTVHVFPTHGRDLPAAHGGLDRPGNDRANLPAVGLRGGEKAREFVVHQAPVAALGEFGALALDEVQRVRQGLHAPSGAGGIEEMGEQGETDPNRVRGQSPRLEIADRLRDVLAPDTRQHALP